MAVPNSNYANDLVAATLEEASPLLYDQVYDPTPTLQWIRRHQKPKPGGQKVTARVRYGQSGQAKAFNTGDSFDLTQAGIVSVAEYAWCNYGTAVLIYEQDVLDNTGDAQIVDLAQERKDEALDDLSDQMATDLYAATWSSSSGKWPSLLVITDTTTDLGNIDVSANAWWEAKATNGASAEISTGVMETMFNNCGMGKGSLPPSQLFGAQNMVESYKTLAGPFGQIQLGTGPAGNRGADLGFERVWFRGRPFDLDPYCPDGTILFLNEKFLELVPNTRCASRMITEQKPVSATPGATEHAIWMRAAIRVRRRASLGRLHTYVAVS